MVELVCVCVCTAEMAEAAVTEAAKAMGAVVVVGLWRARALKIFLLSPRPRFDGAWEAYCQGGMKLWVVAHYTTASRGLKTLYG